MNIEPPTEPPASDSHDGAAVVDPVDERLSAALDGAQPSVHDFGPGSDPLEVLDDDRLVARRRDLEAARDLLAVPPPSLDELTRRRMLRAALAAAPTAPAAKHRDRRLLAAAAVLVVVAAAGWALTRLDVHSNTSSRAAESASAPAVGTALNLHEVSNPALLKGRVEAALRAQPASGAVGNPASPDRLPPVAAPFTTHGGITAAQSRCVATVRVPPGDIPEILAVATFHGAPALVVVARDGPRTLIFVLAAADCRLLGSQFLRE
jgi:hypothetical protein